MKLPYDPFNIIITGVGGQGNVMASRLMGNLLSRNDMYVTIGETFGASQRGGSVMSHLRVSTQPDWSPQIPKGQSHLVIALEPTEALRVLSGYGNPLVKVLCNTRPIHGISVLSGEQRYPDLEDLESMVRALAADAWFINATDAALTIGQPILANIMMIGAAAGLGLLPVDRPAFENAVAEMMSSDKIDLNLKAFDQGMDMIQVKP